MQNLISIFKQLKLFPCSPISYIFKCFSSDNVTFFHYTFCPSFVFLQMQHRVKIYSCAILPFNVPLLLVVISTLEWMDKKPISLFPVEQNNWSIPPAPASIWNRFPLCSDFTTSCATSYCLKGLPVL